MTCIFIMELYFAYKNLEDSLRTRNVKDFHTDDIQQNPVYVF